MSATESHLTGDELIATRPLEAPIDVVWRALTTPGDLAAFWGGDHATVPPGSVAVDLRVGGSFELETRPVGSHSPGRRLSFRYDVVDPPDLVLTEPLTGIVTTIRLSADGDRTTITVRQRRLPPELRTDQARGGLAGILDALDDLLTGSHG
jgi:uncharacterized protein YndB with AHSA1/START domain